MNNTTSQSREVNLQNLVFGGHGSSMLQSLPQGGSQEGSTHLDSEPHANWGYVLRDILSKDEHCQKEEKLHTRVSAAVHQASRAWIFEYHMILPPPPFNTPYLLEVECWNTWLYCIQVGQIFTILVIQCFLACFALPVQSVKINIFKGRFFVQERLCRGLVWLEKKCIL